MIGVSTGIAAGSIISLDRRLGDDVDGLAVVGLAGALHDARDLAELAAHLLDDLAAGACRRPSCRARRTGRAAGRR